MAHLDSEREQEMIDEGKNRATRSDTQNLKELVDAVVPLVREYIDFKKEEFTSREKRLGAMAKHNRNLTYALLAFLTGIIAIMAVLTVQTKISSDALLFLVGTLTGYMILWVQRLVFMATEEEPSD